MKTLTLFFAVAIATSATAQPCRVTAVQHGQQYHAPSYQTQCKVTTQPTYQYQPQQQYPQQFKQGDRVVVDFAVPNQIPVAVPSFQAYLPLAGYGQYGAGYAGSGGFGFASGFGNNFGQQYNQGYAGNFGVDYSTAGDYQPHTDEARDYQNFRRFQAGQPGGAPLYGSTGQPVAPQVPSTADAKLDKLIAVADEQVKLLRAIAGASMTSTPPPERTPAEEGAVVFKDSCLTCHSSTAPRAPVFVDASGVLLPAYKTQAKLYRFYTRAKGGSMPPKEIEGKQTGLESLSQRQLSVFSAFLESQGWTRPTASDAGLSSGN